MRWPDHHRYLDYIIIAFYILAFLIIYLVEIEQLIISDPANFVYPGWPPANFVDMTHWWGENYHHTLYQRPAWYKATIWVDVLFSGPIYVFGIYAFWKKRCSIKYPALIQASMLAVIVFISIWEEIYGTFAGDQKGIVLASMILWIAVPILIIFRTIGIKKV